MRSRSSAYRLSPKVGTRSSSLLAVLAIKHREADDHIDGDAVARQRHLAILGHAVFPLAHEADKAAPICGDAALGHRAIASQDLRPLIEVRMRLVQPFAGKLAAEDLYLARADEAVAVAET